MPVNDAEVMRGRAALPALFKISLDAWLENHREQILVCPHQPGSLKITAQACARRHLAANHVCWATIGSEPFAAYLIKMSLKPCHNCSLGAKNAKQYSIDDKLAPKSNAAKTLQDKTKVQKSSNYRG